MSARTRAPSCRPENRAAWPESFAMVRRMMCRVPWRNTRLAGPAVEAPLVRASEASANGAVEEPWDARARSEKRPQGQNRDCSQPDEPEGSGDGVLARDWPRSPAQPPGQPGAKACVDQRPRENAQQCSGRDHDGGDERRSELQQLKQGEEVPVGMRDHGG